MLLNIFTYMAAVFSTSFSATLANLALYQQLIAGGVPVPQAATQQGQQYPQQKEGKYCPAFIQIHVLGATFDIRKTVMWSRLFFVVLQSKCQL